MLVTVLALATAMFTRHLMPSQPPKWLDMQIAGYSLETSDSVFLRDKKTGFFLIHTYDCDGAINYITLTRDHALTQGASNEVVSNGRTNEVDYPLVKSIQKLSTSKGVTIGDKPDQLTNRLGKPSKIEKSGSRKQFVDYVYHFKRTTRDKNNPHAMDIIEFTETYTFKRGVLIQIEFSHGSGIA